MTNFTQDNSVNPTPFAMPRLPLGKMLTSALPFMLLAVPGTAYAQQATNTATVTAPTGAIETNTGNNSATDTDTVLADITANDDSESTAAGGPGVTDIISVLANDDFNTGTPVPTDVDISVATGSSVPSQLTFDTTDGTVDVVANTPAGVYTFDYTICEAGSTTNCSTATVEVTVTAPSIFADNEVLGPIVGSAGQADIENALDGDTVGSANATVGTGGNVILTVDTPATPVNPGDPVPTIDVTTGLVSVPAGTPADDYQITYQICDVVNPTTNCITATIDVEVVAGLITADDDAVGGINGTTGQDDVLNVLPGDELNNAPATVDNIDISIVTAATPINGGPVPTLDITDGNISVPPGTPAGDYTIRYEICEELNPTNCIEADAVVTVVAPLINAEDDEALNQNGVVGADDIIDVLANDELNSGQATLANVDITVITPATPIGGGNVPVLNTADGTVDLPAGTPAGTYTITYQIEDELNSGNTNTAIATITVAPSVDLSITKTNGVTEVNSGQNVTYTLVVGNAGPDAAIGAVVTDTPGAGLTCAATNTVTLTGDGVPAGSFTIADLTGVGITLGTLNAGEATTITYSCTVD